MIDPRRAQQLRNEFLRECEPLIQMKARLMMFDRPSFRVCEGGSLEVIDHGRTPKSIEIIEMIDEMIDGLRSKYIDKAKGESNGD